MRLIDSESLYQRFLDYKLKHSTRYTDIDEIRIVISDEPTVDVLEQIRDEIEHLDYLNIEDGSDGYDKYVDQYDVLQIIDKYKDK